MKLNKLPAPRALIKPFNLTIHGITRTDNYYWLSERENPEVLEYLKAENAYLEKVLEPTKQLREDLFSEMKGRIKEDDESTPYKNGNFFYFTRFEEGSEYPLFFRKSIHDEKVELLLDCNVLAQGYEYFELGGFEVSDDGQMLLYSADYTGRRNYTVKVKTLKNKKILEDEISETEGGNYAWAADNKSFYYISKDPQTLLGNKVYRHILNSPVENDLLMYEEKDHQYYMGLYRMKSKKYIAIVSEHTGVSSEYQLIDTTNPNAEAVTFLKRKDRLEYTLEHSNGEFFIVTNLNKATNFQVMKVKENGSFESKNWEEFILHREDVLIEGIEVFRDFIVVQERSQGLIRFRIINHKNDEEHYLDFGESVYSVFPGINPEYDSEVFRYGYTSMTTPRSTFDYNMNLKVKILKKEQEVLGGFIRENYKTERIFVKSRDGVKIPVSLVYNKETPLDGTAPLLQYAYGSYGFSLDATFSSNRLSLLDRGFVYAVSHVRGGQEMGRNWYEEGRKFKKQNTFNDFIDCTQALVDLKYGAKNKIFAMGGSAGGMLMGVLANQAPELYLGIVAAVPFVDVVTTMLDENIPLTTGEFEEWGNPKFKKDFEYMLSYSPYDNVKPQDYPNILVTTGFHDSQVQYWEPAKWVSKLRENNISDNFILFFTDLSTGHGGSSGRFNSLRTIALEFAFIIALVE